MRRRFTIGHEIGRESSRPGTHSPPFYVAPTPVILCEGSTDNVYLIHAIRRHSATYPKLPTKNADGTIDIGVRIYKYVDKTTGQILGPGGGASHFGHLMNIYQAATKKFSAPSQHHPVILVVDNDGGADSIYSAVKKITGSKPMGTEPYIHVVANMYLVPIPMANSTIEDLFDPSVLAVTLGGKTLAEAVARVISQRRQSE